MARMLQRNSISTMPMPPLLKPRQNCMQRHSTEVRDIANAYLKEARVHLADAELAQAYSHMASAVGQPGCMQTCWCEHSCISTYGLLERVAVVHPEAVCCPACEATIVLVEGYAQHLQALHLLGCLLFRPMSRPCMRNVQCQTLPNKPQSWYVRSLLADGPRHASTVAVVDEDLMSPLYATISTSKGICVNLELIELLLRGVTSTLLTLGRVRLLQVRSTD